MIDKTSAIPVYYQLKEDIKNKINKGFWKVGQCIDSERELAENYNVSRMTVRQALGELVQDGIVVREKGKGTFVCEPKFKQQDMMSFSEMVKKRGLNLKNKIINFEKVHTPIEMQELLPFEEVYKIHRLRIVEDEKIAEEIVYIPCDYCGFLNEELLKGSLYKILEGYGYKIEQSEASIKAIVVDNYYKNLFEIGDSIPLIKIYSKNLDKNGKLLFIEEAVYRSDKYILEVNIFRKEGDFR